MNLCRRISCLVIGLSIATQGNFVSVVAQDAGEETPSAAKKVLPLEIGQQAVLSRFDRFEKELVQMAEQFRKADPERAELLFRTHSKSQQQRVIGQMRMVHELLAGKNPQFGDSIQRQEELVTSLVTLLDLLQSENRISEIEAERARVKEILKNVNKLIGKEKDVRANTERGSNPNKSAKDQENVAKDAKQLIDDVKEQDTKKQAERESNNPADDKGADKPPGKEGDDEDPMPPKDGNIDPKEPGESDPKSGEPKDGQPQDGQPQDGQPKGGEPKEGEPQNGKPQDGKPQEGQPQEGELGEQKDQQQTPGREDLEEARQEMEKAIKELKDKKDRGKASRHQDEAIRQLLEAKEKLEEILRQLREDENSLTLASLESRFRKMLSMQLLVYQETLRLDKESDGKDANLIARGKQLATQEEEIVQEVDKALVVLREEGSSVAFPEAVEAIREDAASIVQLLDQGKAGELTQTLEQAVIEAVEEMVDALQKEMEKKKDDEEQQPGQQQQGQPQDKPLVDALSELKMLRSLQLRINRRTRQLGRMIEGDQAGETELLKQLKTLSGRQSRIQRATYDLSTGRNK
ncbi:MAG: hypothetical protein ACKVHE_02520 [Planctomycetales bacterium]